MDAKETKESVKYCKYCGHKIGNDGKCTNPDCNGTERAWANQEKIAKAMKIMVPVVVVVALIVGVCCLFGNNKEPEGTQPSTSSAPTEPQETTLLHSSDLESIKEESLAMLGTTTYEGKLLEESGVWTPIAINYSGYFVRNMPYVSLADYLVELVYEVVLATPSAERPSTLYAIIQYDAYTYGAESIDELRGGGYSIRWFAKPEEWFNSIDANSFRETSLTMEEMGALMGWDAYLSEAAEISATDASTLIQRGRDMLSLHHSDIVFDSACLYVANDIFSAARNEMYIYFRQTQTHEDGASVTYYFPLHATNIKVVTDEYGNRKLDLESVVLVQEDYLMSLPTNRGWAPLKWAE